MNSVVIDDLVCEFCGNQFCNPSGKRRHQRSAKYCSGDIDLQYKCVCPYQTSVKTNFERHIGVCEYRMHVNDLNRQIVELSLELAQTRSMTQTVEENVRVLVTENRDLITQDLESKNKLKERDAEILELKLANANKSGKVEVLEKKPVAAVKNKNTTNVIGDTNTYVNPKLASVRCDTIRPFTIETVKAELEAGGYSYERFIQGEQGIIDFINGLTLDGEQRSYVCTDSARNKFHRLLESRKWKDDNGATFLNNVFTELFPLAKEYYESILASMGATDATLEALESADLLLERTRPIFLALEGKGPDARNEVINKVRVEVKKLASV